MKKLEVSIPHRYAKNPFRKRLGLHLLQFQFLIGTLKTRIGLPPRERLFLMFQFLIGTLKTVGSHNNSPQPGVFQFLIGTLKTLEMMEDVDVFHEFQFLIGTLKTYHLPVLVYHMVLRFNSS